MSQCEVLKMNNLILAVVLSCYFLATGKVKVARARGHNIVLFFRCPAVWRPATGWWESPLGGSRGDLHSGTVGDSEIRHFRLPAVGYRSGHLQAAGLC